MRKIVSVSFLFCTVTAMAQQFTLDDIYKNYTYYHYPFFDACQIYGNTIYCGEYTIPFESETGSLGSPVCWCTGAVVSVVGGHADRAVGKRWVWR